MWGSGCKLGGGDCGSLEAFGDGTGKHRGPIWAHLRRGHVSRLKNMKQEKRPNGSWAWTPRVNSGIPSPCQEEFECIFINLKFLQNDFSLPPSKTFSSYQLQPKSLFCPRLLLALLLKTEETWGESLSDTFLCKSAKMLPHPSSPQAPTEAATGRHCEQPIVNP